MFSDAPPRSGPSAAARRLRYFWLRLRRVRFSSFSLRLRLLCLAVALVLVGLVVSDALVLDMVRPKLVARVDQQLTRMAGAVEHGHAPVAPPGFGGAKLISPSLGGPKGKIVVVCFASC